MEGELKSKVKRIQSWTYLIYINKYDTSSVNFKNEMKTTSGINQTCLILML